MLIERGNNLVGWATPELLDCWSVPRYFLRGVAAPPSDTQDHRLAFYTSGFA